MTLRFTDLPFVATAAVELLLARMKLAALASEQLTQGLALEPSSSTPPVHGDPLPQAVERASYFIPRVAARMPWRADCLVQALAARRWLLRQGIETQLFLGVRGTSAPFEAHAWLKWGHKVVTGGIIDGYSPLHRPGSLP
jgi:hypothetical protein